MGGRWVSGDGCRVGDGDDDDGRRAGGGCDGWVGDVDGLTMTMTMGGAGWLGDKYGVVGGDDDDDG